jgi:hypothetical protein
LPRIASGAFTFVPVLLVAAFAFLLGSYPARNSDLWMHLAAGRQLAHGDSPKLGSAVGARQAPLATWLYDLLSYGLYSVVGGPGLVLVKAFLVVLLAVLLLRLSQTGRATGVAAVCTALAILAMSTRLLLQPATLSYLFLALTLWLLVDHEPIGRLVRQPRWLKTWLPPWPLLLLFVIWANVDGWFVLGLATVALLGIGQVMDDAGPGDHGRLARFARLVVSWLVLAAVCLLNPSALLHQAAFLQQLPVTDLVAWLQRTGTSATAALPWPLQKAYYTSPLGLTPAGLAYFPLLALGLISFLLTLPRWHWQRFLPWLGLALWSALQVRAVPFFAVLCGPVLAWNLQDFFARHTESHRREGPLWEPALATVRGLLVVLGLAFLACAWPGWLQAPPFEPRRWAIETPPSLELGAQAARRWHQQGVLGPQTRGLHLSPDSVWAFAWFCPEEKGNRDERLAATVGDQEAPEKWQELMRSAGYDHVIVYDSDRARLFNALNRLLADPQQWPLLFREGELAVFGWRDPARAAAGDLFHGSELNFERLAFHPSAVRKAPAQATEKGPEERSPWDTFWRAAPARPVDRDEAAFYLFHAEALRQSAPLRHFHAWEATEAAGLVGAAGAWSGPASLLDAQVRLMFVDAPLEGTPAPLAQVTHEYQRRFTRQRDDTPPALLYLAIRAARRALAVNPDDGNAYLILGESYLRLLRDTRERTWAARMPDLLQLRRVQASTALNQALVLKPDLAQAHLELGGLYEEMGCFDLALHHLSTHARLYHEKGPPPGSNLEQYRQQAANYDAALKELVRSVDGREKEVASEEGRYRVFDRAMLAWQKGLAGKARDILLNTDVANFGAPGMALELELMLRTGRARDIPRWINEEQEAALGPFSYHWLLAQAQAALGNYAEAQEEWKFLTLEPQLQEPRLHREIARLLTRAVLAEVPGTESLPDLFWRTRVRNEFRSVVASIIKNFKQGADMCVLRGLVALEEGDVEEAHVAFGIALDALKLDAESSGVEFNGRIVAQTCLEWLKE